MTRILLKELPRYECLAEAAQQFPDLDPTTCEAFLHLIRAGDDLWRSMGSHFTEHGITQGRFMIMMLLLDKKHGGCPRPRTPAELADFAQVSRATITGLLDTLERDGFVRREPDANDRRMVTVHLTKRGEDFMHELLPRHFRLISALMAGLNPSECKTLVRLLAKVIATVGEREGTSPPCGTSCSI